MEVAMTAIQKAPNHPLIASDRIEGTLVRRHNGEKIGKIQRLMIDKESGTIAYAVMSFGGLFGLGDNYYQNSSCGLAHMLRARSNRRCRWSAFSSACPQGTIGNPLR